MLSFVKVLFALLLFCPFNSPSVIQEATDPVRAELDKAIAAYRGSVETAEQGLQTKSGIVIAEATKKLKTRERILRKVELAKQIEEFRASGRAPSDRRLRKITASCSKAVEKAEKVLRRAFEKAAGKYDRAGKDILAVEVLKEEHRLLSVHGVELLKNPGCENPLDNDDIVGWHEHSGSWNRGNGKKQAATGTGFFSASGGNDARAELYQDVDLAAYRKSLDRGSLQLKIAGKVRSFDQEPGDIARLRLNFLDAAGTQMEGGYDSGMGISKGVWMSVGGTVRVPKGARTARVRLISIRRLPDQSSRQRSTDGHFDDVSLSAAKPIRQY